MPGFTATIAAQHQQQLLAEARQHRLGRDITGPGPRRARRVLRWSRPRAAAVQPC
jgi:hypothetical protein